MIGRKGELMASEQINLFFANGLPGISLPKKKKNSDLPNPDPPKPGRFSAGVFCEQLINSFIIAGIAAISTLAATGEEQATGKVAGIAFGLTFLIEMRKYRKI